MSYTVGLMVLVALIAPLAMQGRPECDEQIRAGRAALKAGRYAEAERQYSAALAEGKNPAPADAWLVTALAELGFARMALGHHDEAAAVLRRALGILEGFPGSNSTESAKLWQALGTAYYQEHLYSQAEYAYRRALDLRTGAGTLDPQLAGELSANLAVVYMTQHQNGKANAALEAARQALDQWHGTESNSRIHQLLVVGTMYHLQGRFTEAEATLREALASLDRIPDPDGTLVVAALNNVGVEYMSRRDYTAARGVISRAVGRAEQGTPFSRPEMMKVLTNYRVCLQHTVGRKEIREFDSRARLILGTIPRAQTDGLLIDVTEAGPRK